MNVKYLTSLAMAAAIISGCSDVKELNSARTEECSLTASMDCPTRVGFTTEGKFYWSANDKLGVTTARTPKQFTPFTISSTPGSASAEFKGRILAGDTVEGYAVYPYSDDHYISADGILTYTFPASYTYNKVDTDFGSAEQGYGNSFNPAMYGRIEGATIGMKHLGAIFCIKIDPLPTGNDLQLVLSTNKKINGEYTADIKNSDDSYFTASEASDASQKKVSIKFSNSTEGTSGVFYIPVPTGNYDNVRLKVLDTDNNELVNLACGEYKVGRRNLTVISVIEGSITASESKTVDDAEEATAALESGATSVSISSEIEDNTTIEIPKSSTSDPVSLSLQNIADNATLTIEDNSGSEASVEDLTLSIPDNAAAAPSVNVAMPNTTVTLSAISGKATFEEVSAETADETIIIGSGVTVKKLIVKKGNVLMMANSKVESFERDNSNTATVNVYAPAAITVPQGFVYAGTKEVAALVKAMKKGGSYSLDSDIDISATKVIVPAGTASVLDLNGHVLTAANNANILVNGTFTLKDSKSTGKIVASKDYSAYYASAIISVYGENASMTMESGYIYAVRADAANKGQYGIAVFEGGDFTMKGGKIEAGWYAISGNGTDQTQNAEITIEDGELISTADYAMYLPQSGTTTINGGTIKGACGAIGQRSGDININGGTFISEGTGYTGDWGDGTGSTGNAVLSMGKGTAGVYGEGTTTINGGTFVAEGNAKVLDKTGLAKLKAVVNGGTFSDFTTLLYRRTENANVSIVLNKDFEFTSAQSFSVGTTTIDLNNHSIICKPTAKKAAAALYISGNATLDIKGEGSVKCIGEDDKDYGRMAVWTYGKATVNIYGGSFYNSQKVGGQIDLIYATYNSKINIYGGTFESGSCNEGGQYWVLNKKDEDRETCQINVKGGTFVNFNPANNKSEGENTSFLAEGYKVMCDGAEATAVHDIAGSKKIYTVVSK